MAFPRQFRLALTVSLGLLLAGTAAAESPAGSIVKYLPDSADGLFCVNVRRLLDAELIKKVGLDKVVAGKEAQQALSTLGLNPLKDIDRVLIAGAGNNQIILVIQGRFDPSKLSAVALEHAKDAKGALTIHKSDNGTIYELTKLDEIVKLPPQAAGAGVNLKGQVPFAAIPDKGNIVISGSRDVAADVLAKAAGKKTTQLKSKLLSTLIEKIDHEQALAIAMPAPPGEMQITSITGGIVITGDVKVDLAVNASNAAAAREINGKIAEQLKMVKGIAGIFAAQQAELAELGTIIDAVKHEAKDTTVTVRADVKGETIERLVKGLAALAAKSQGK